MDFVCSNCGIKFSMEEASVCPRCNSKKLRHVEKKAAPGEKEFQQPPQAQQTQQTAQHQHPNPAAPRIYGDTKGAWKSFHQAEQKNCPQCGGTEFKMDFKHKEKICLKCGSLIPLRRRPA